MLLATRVRIVALRMSLYFCKMTQASAQNLCCEMTARNRASSLKADVLPLRLAELKSTPFNEHQSKS